MVAEPAFAQPIEAGREELAEQLAHASVAEVIDRGSEAGRSICLAELSPDGTVIIQGDAAPSVLKVCADGPGLTPLPVPTREPLTVAFRPGEIVVLCSPGLLVEPPGCLLQGLADECPPSGDGGWEWALRGLVCASVGHGGGVALARLGARSPQEAAKPAGT